MNVKNILKRLRKDKKGSMMDAFGIVMITIVFIIIVVACFYVYSVMQPALNQTLANNVSTQVLAQGETSLLGFDKMLVLVFGGLVFASLIGAFLIDTHPVFFIVSIILLIVFIFISIILGEATNTMLSSGFNSSYNQFPIMRFYISRLPLISLLVGALIMIVLFAKLTWASGGGY